MKSWIKREIYALPGNEKINDTAYTRYSFGKGKVDISFYPGWNEYQQDWSLAGNQLQMGPNTYLVEELTDSSMTISQAGFRRIVLDNEAYLNQKTENLPLAGTFNNEPVYQANSYVTPRYKKEKFQYSIKQNLDGYNIRKATTFAVSFIVKKDGSVDNIQVIKSITYGFDTEVINQQKKTSKDWIPAVYKGQPVQTQMIYTIKYLDSNSR